MTRHTRIVGLLAIAGLMLPIPGCGSTRSTPAPGSGDPEADRRAEMRVGSEADQSSDSSGDKGVRARTLYERLGGDRGIGMIVDELTTRAIEDPRVNFARHDVKTSWIGTRAPEWDRTTDNVQRFKQHMFEFLCLAAGGPAEYTGRGMREVHAKMRITNNEFDAMVGDIKTAMDRLGYAAREKRDLLAIVETTRKEIVEKK